MGRGEGEGLRVWVREEGGEVRDEEGWVREVG